jgi:molecular chaperone HscB
VTSARPADYFSALGLPRKLGIDMPDLEKRFRERSRACHPDYFANAPAAERRRSLEQSSYLNDAYRTLKNPASRVEYLLGIEGLALKGPQEQSKAVPPALLEEVFALNEELDEIRLLKQAHPEGDAWRARLARARQPIEVKRQAHEAQVSELSAQWDAAVDGDRAAEHGRAILLGLRERLLERSYIANLLASIERELNG